MEKLRPREFEQCPCSHNSLAPNGIDMGTNGSNAGKVLCTIKCCAGQTRPPHYYGHGDGAIVGPRPTGQQRECGLSAPPHHVEPPDQPTALFKEKWSLCAHHKPGRICYVRTWTTNNGSVELRGLGRCRARLSLRGKVCQENF